MSGLLSALRSLDPLAELRRTLLAGQMELAFRARGFFADTLYSPEYERWFREHVVHAGRVYQLDAARCEMEEWLWQRELANLRNAGYDTNFL